LDRGGRGTWTQAKAQGSQLIRWVCDESGSLNVYSLDGPIRLIPTAWIRASQDHAAEVTRRSIQGAVSRRFGFYRYDPYPTSGEAELRQAMLTHQSMAAVRATSVDVKELNSSANDSILNVAIDYPEALSYLLERGISADIANEFGKTPLMYAVQHDQAAAVRLLLQAGADPNATTKGGPDNCAYDLKWRNVTPLHYAVRYASREIVQALLDAGAATFMRAESDSDSSRGGYPLEWLKHVTPRRLSPVDVTALEAQLRVPSNEERVKLSATFAAKTEAANSARKPVDAYRAMREAQLADPSNYRAAEDLPILALKAGELGSARQGSDTALTMAKTPGDQAAALFNKGLVCEQIQYLARAARTQSVTIQPSAAYWAARFDTLGLQALILDYFVSGLIALGVTVGAMHVMEAAMSSRGEEIAILRAIGFAGTSIAVAFIFEAVVLACLGAALGTVIDWLWLDGWLVNGAYGVFRIMVTARLLVIAIGWALAISLLGAVLPAVRAVTIPVRDALGA
jgi:ankyrin repeat protein